MSTTGTEQRTVLVANLVVIAEIAAKLSVSYSTVWNWTLDRETTGFPLPVKETVGNQQPDIYDYAEVYLWFQDWLKRKAKYYGLEEGGQ